MRSELADSYSHAALVVDDFAHSNQLLLFEMDVSGPIYRKPTLTASEFKQAVFRSVAGAWPPEILSRFMPVQMTTKKFNFFSDPTCQSNKYFCSQVFHRELQDQPDVDPFPPSNWSSANAQQTDFLADFIHLYLGSLPVPSDIFLNSKYRLVKESINLNLSEEFRTRRLMIQGFLTLLRKDKTFLVSLMQNAQADKKDQFLGLWQNGFWQKIIAPPNQYPEVSSEAYFLFAKLQAWLSATKINEILLLTRKQLEGLVLTSDLNTEILKDIDLNFRSLP